MLDRQVRLQRHADADQPLRVVLARALGQVGRHAPSAFGNAFDQAAADPRNLVRTKRSALPLVWRLGPAAHIAQAHLFAGGLEDLLVAGAVVGIPRTPRLRA